MADKVEKPGGALGLVWDSITAFFDVQFKSVWVGFLDVLGKAVGVVFGGIYEYVKDSEEASWEKVTNQLVTAGFMDRDDLKGMEFFKGIPWPGSYIVRAFIILIQWLNMWAGSETPPAVLSGRE